MHTAIMAGLKSRGEVSKRDAAQLVATAQEALDSAVGAAELNGVLSLVSCLLDDHDALRVMEEDGSPMRVAGLLAELLQRMAQPALADAHEGAVSCALAALSAVQAQHAMLLWVAFRDLVLLLRDLLLVQASAAEAQHDWRVAVSVDVLPNFGHSVAKLRHMLELDGSEKVGCVGAADALRQHSACTAYHVTLRSEQELILLIGCVSMLTASIITFGAHAVEGTESFRELWGMLAVLGETCQLGSDAEQRLAMHVVAALGLLLRHRMPALPLAQRCSLALLRLVRLELWECSRAPQAQRWLDMDVVRCSCQMARARPPLTLRASPQVASCIELVMIQAWLHRRAVIARVVESLMETVQQVLAHPGARLSLELRRCLVQAVVVVLQEYHAASAKVRA